jgi:hypothetical protein
MRGCQTLLALSCAEVAASQSIRSRHPLQVLLSVPVPDASTLPQTATISRRRSRQALKVSLGSVFGFLGLLAVASSVLWYCLRRRRRAAEQDVVPGKHAVTKEDKPSIYDVGYSTRLEADVRWEARVRCPCLTVPGLQH